MSLIAAPIVALGDTDDVGRRTGMYFSILAIGALAGPPSECPYPFIIMGI